MQAGSTNDDGTTPWTRGSWPDATDAAAVGGVEVVVIGAGVAGCTVALGLAEAGVRVAVVDPAPGDGAAGRGAGLIAAGLSEHPARLVDALGPERAAAVFALASASAERLAACGVSITRCDQVWVATAPEEDRWIARSVDVLHRMGRPAQVLDAGGLAARGISGSVGLVAPGDALVDDPGAALAALARRAVQAGAVWVRGRVDAVRQVAPGLVATVDGQALPTEVVVWAAGAGQETSRDGAMSPLEPALEPLLWPVRDNALVVDLPAPLPPAVGRAGHGWTAFRPLPGGRALITGCRWATPHLEIGERSPVPVDAVQDKLAAFARSQLGATGPALHRWAWISAHSCDGLPLVGPMPGDPRRLVCTGFGGYDWSLGPAAAALLVDGLVGTATAPVAWLAPSRMA